MDVTRRKTRNGHRGVVEPKDGLPGTGSSRGRGSRPVKRQTLAVFALLALAAIVVAAYAVSAAASSSSQGSAFAHATNGAVPTPPYDLAAVKKWGWIGPNPLPNLACTTDSYQQALRNGVSIGIAAIPPYSDLNPTTHQGVGVDPVILETALNFIGIHKIRWTVMPYGSLIPALLSARIDIMGSDVHVNAQRLAQIAFSSPAWWYGPAMAVRKGNPLHIASYQDLNKPSVQVEVARWS